MGHELPKRDVRIESVPPSTADIKRRSQQARSVQILLQKDFSHAAAQF
jgi:hypothetical protein